MILKLGAKESFVNQQSPAVSVGSGAYRRPARQSLVPLLLFSHTSAMYQPSRSYERTAQSFYERLHHAVRKESWGRSLLQLAWTAGPVTYLALQGGYLLGYGSTAPPGVLIYFAAYTLIAGAAAIVVRLVYNATRGKQLDEATAQLQSCLDRLPRLIQASRSRALSHYQDDAARVVATGYLLENPDATEVAIETALNEIDAPELVVRTVVRADVMRRNGLSAAALAPDFFALDQLAVFLRELRVRSPDVARLVEERSSGIATTQRRGRQRTEGFIERVIFSAAVDDDTVMTEGDVEEVFSVVTELLIGRSYPLLVFRYEGNRTVRDAFIRFERARRAYRSAVVVRNSRLRMVAEHLGDRINRVLASVSRIVDPASLLGAVLAAQDELIAELKEATGVARRRLSDELRRSSRVYRDLEKASADLLRRHAALVRDFNSYQEAAEQCREAVDEPIELVSEEGQGDGVRIEERNVELSKKARLELAPRVFRILNEAGVWEAESYPPETDKLKRAAVEVLAALEGHIPLHRTDVQQAIELSRAPLLAALDPDNTVETRTGWAIAMVRDVAPNRKEYVMRRLSQLIRFHGLRMGQQTRLYLQSSYGLTEDEIRRIGASEPEKEPPWMRPPFQVPKRSAELAKLVTHPGRRPERRP